MTSASFKTIDDTLYVGNLPFSATEEALHALFAAGGRKVASVKVISNYKTGRSRGFGFVRMATIEDADSALELDGSELDGRRLSVGKGKHKTLRRR